MVYLTENLITGNKYIGKHYGLRDDKYLGSGRLLIQAIKKHGRENFNRVILAEYPDEQTANAGEEKWIDDFRAVSRNDFYNMAAGGAGGDTMRGASDDAKHAIATRRSAIMKKVRANPEVERRRLENLKARMAARTQEELDAFYGRIRGGGSPNAKGVITPSGSFPCQSDAAKHYGITLTTVGNRCRSASPKFIGWSFEP